jgi:hypothetical protein
MLFLGLHIVLAFAIFLLLSLDLVHFVFDEHFLQVVTFLVALIRLQFAFSLHLGLKAINKLYFLAECLFLVVTLLFLFLVHLTIAAFLFSDDLVVLLMLLLLLTLSQKLNVLLLKPVVHSLLVSHHGRTLGLVVDLLIKFLTDKATAFLFAHEGLLLFLVVQKLIELLNSNPLILLSNF